MPKLLTLSVTVRTQRPQRIPWASNLQRRYSVQDALMTNNKLLRRAQGAKLVKMDKITHDLVMFSNTHIVSKEHQVV